MKESSEIFLLRIDVQTYRPTDTPSYRDARTHLKTAKREKETIMKRKMDKTLRRVDPRVYFADIFFGGGGGMVPGPFMNDR